MPEALINIYIFSLVIFWHKTENNFRQMFWKIQIECIYKLILNEYLLAIISEKKLFSFYRWLNKNENKNL